MQGDPVVIFFEKKFHNAEKNWKGDPSASPGIVCYAEKKEKPFWFSSLGQHVQFCSTLKVCRTFGRTILLTSGVSKKNTMENPWL